MLIKVILITISCRPLFMLLWGRQLQECWKTKTSSMRIMNHKFFLNHCVTVSVCLFSRNGGIQPIPCTLGNSGTLNSLWLNWIVCSKGMCCQLPTDTFNQLLINTQLTSQSTSQSTVGERQLVFHRQAIEQGLYGSWKTWKVLEFYYGIFQDWRVLEKGHWPWKVLEICLTQLKNMKNMEGSKEN